MTQLVPPPPRVARTRELTYETVAAVLEDVLLDGGLRISPLGPAWSRDVDAHVRRVPDPIALEAAGWVDLDALLGRLGYHADGRWAVVLENEVIGAADLQCGNPPDPVSAVLERVRRQGYFGAREAAELEELRGQGYTVPRTPHPRSQPVVRRCRAALRSRLRPRELVEIVGADPSVRCTLSARLVEDLTRAGVPATRARASENNAEVDAGGRGVAPTHRRWLAAHLSTWRAFYQSRGVVVVDRQLPAPAAAEGLDHASRPGPRARLERATPLPPALARVVLDDPASIGHVRSVPRGFDDERLHLRRRGSTTLNLEATRPVAQLSLAVLRHLATVSRA